MQSVKEVVSESVGTAWIPSWGMVSLISSCQNSSWWRLQRGEWIFELCLPPGLTLQSGIPSLLPHLGTWINEMATLAWVAPPKEDGVIWSSPGPQWGFALLLLMEAELWLCPAQSICSEGTTDTLSLCCAETLPDKNEPVFMLCHKWWMASGLLARVCSGDHQLVQLALVVLISKGKLWNVSVAH